jgi:Arc/MetJ-type ribon-helix-helix transcriptional regulator
MTISLDKDVLEFLQEQVRAGVCASASEFINDIVRSVREGQRALEITPELEAWLLASADEPTTQLTKMDFEGIRERVKGRTNKPAS